MHAEAERVAGEGDARHERSRAHRQDQRCGAEAERERQAHEREADEQLTGAVGGKGEAMGSHAPIVPLRRPRECEGDHGRRYRVRVARVRLDSLLADRGLFPSRSRAAAAVLAGDVLLGPGRQRAEKPGQLVAGDVEIAVSGPPPYVSRGGIKLANALDALGLAVEGRRALDVGASTGGFTDCLLQRGAAHVIALDVAYGELDWQIRQDARVTVLERMNARALEADALPYRPDLVVIDVSFISLRKVLPAVLAATAPAFDCLAMVKPQFEVGRERLGKGGVVRDAALRRAAIAEVAECGQSLGASVMGLAPSGLPGPAGNRETFLWLAEGGRAGLVPDVSAAVAEVDA
jgi:23S rRNA (cytidine1920-2'-O)/16S rRNA (cytidine1409-2'-O)-methyltransferase